MTVAAKAKERSFSALQEQHRQEDVFGLTADMINLGVEEPARVRARLRQTHYDDYVIEHVIALIGKAKALRQSRRLLH